MKTILYVDDEKINLELFEMNFKFYYNVLTALSAEKGLNYFKSNEKIDLVITDLKMPGLNGLEFIKEIKKIKADLKCILLTGFLEQDVMLEAINENLIYKYILKPWKKEDLASIINSALC